MKTVSSRLFLLLSVFSLLTFCKKRDTSFEIRGVTSSDADSIGLYPGDVDRDFIDPALYRFKKSKVINGEFVFKHEIPYPYIMSLYSTKGGYVPKFFIEPGITELSVMFPKYPEEAVFLKGSMSPTQKEYDLLRTTKLDPIKEAWWQSKNPITKEEYGRQVDSILVGHLKANPNSYVALWLMLDRFSNDYEYREDYEEALDFFSDEIKQLDIFKKFKAKITFKKDFSFMGRDLPLKDINETNTTFSLKDFKDKKYLLIDFWFSNCGPCLSTMPKYKPIYDKYRTKGFEIVSISTDKSKEDVVKWKRLIEEKGFNWAHYLDLGGLETHKMKIRTFPTTFLIDTDGNVIKKDIALEDLEKFLNEAL